MMSREQAQLPVKAKRREVVGCELHGHGRKYSCELSVTGPQVFSAEALNFRVRTPQGYRLQLLSPSDLTLRVPSGASSTQLAAVLGRWLRRRPEFSLRGVYAGDANRFLEALGLGWHVLEDVLLAELHTGRPGYAPAGPSLLPLPWLRFGEVPPAWVAQTAANMVAADGAYRALAIPFWTERLRDTSDVAGALELEPDQGVRRAVHEHFFLDEAGQVRGQAMLQRFESHIPPPGGYMVLNCAAGRFLLCKREVPQGLVAYTLDGQRQWHWHQAALYLEGGGRRPVYQGPKDMAELLDWLLDANLSLLPGPVGERLLAELRGL
ncbi:hypothetical protein Deipr_2415 (plasmid) [Deinococcus proteolyticus MRP]|uniref:Uncharacterized protein n=2 Tax=Deinococcus TaxID=1298 RepID=F0RQI0_DEIPM|nr:hypothetical protein Deipr_2415 [Deinococcus proteolyticus MRP]